MVKKFCTSLFVDLIPLKSEVGGVSKGQLFDNQSTDLCVYRILFGLTDGVEVTEVMGAFKNFW